MRTRCSILRCAIWLVVAAAAHASASSPSLVGACPSPATAEGIACLEDAVRALLQQWVVAWAEGDAETYLGLYEVPRNDESEVLRTAREEQRREWLRDQEDVVITLDLESMGVAEDGGIDVIFVQHYRSATRTSSLRKQLFLVWRDGAPRIRREVVLD